MFPSRYFDSPMFTTAMETHIKSIKEDRFAFLDNWDESMASTSLPNYQKNSHFQLLSSSKHKGDRIFDSWTQNQVKSLAINVHPSHTVCAASLLIKFVNHVQLRMKSRKPTPHLRLCNLQLPPSLSPMEQANPSQKAPSHFRARCQPPGQNTAPTT